MVLYHLTLSSFLSFQHQIEHFLCHWKRKIKMYKCSLNLKSKGTKEIMQEEKEWYFVSNFVSRPPLFLTTISCSFFIHFERFQRLQMRHFKIYKTCLKWKVKKKIKKKSWRAEASKSYWTFLKKSKTQPPSLWKGIFYSFSIRL
jgi:hypothetical protein